MPTINQLIRKGGRHQKVSRIKATALRRSFNTLTTKPVKTLNPQKRGVCTVVKTMTPGEVKNVVRLKEILGEKDFQPFENNKIVNNFFYGALSEQRAF